MPVFRKMPPLKKDQLAEIDEFIKVNKVSLFSKTTCGYCEKVNM